jgi:ABC-type transport system substrate-binding protein
VGINVTIKTYPANLYFADASSGGVLRSGHFQLAYDARLLGSDPNDEPYYGCNEFSPHGNNSVYWCNAAAERAMQDALKTYDLRQRAADYAIVQNQMAREIPTIPLWEVQRYDAFSVRVRGFDPSTAGPTFWNAWAWRLSH